MKNTQHVNFNKVGGTRPIYKITLNHGVGEVPNTRLSASLKCWCRIHVPHEQIVFLEVTYFLRWHVSRKMKSMIVFKTLEKSFH